MPDNWIDEIRSIQPELSLEEIVKLLQRTITGKRDSDQHAITLFSMVISNKAKNIVELGSRHGESTVPLVLGAAALGEESRVTSVDIDEEPLLPKQLSKTMQRRWRFVQEDAIDFLKKQKDIIDLVYIDDWHAEEHVLQELKLLDRLVNKESIILMHDAMHSFSHPDYNQSVKPEDHEFAGQGVYGAITRFVEEYQDYEYMTIPVCHGLTILRKNG
jgi:predicted O-methyltransferase YrrM